MIEELVPIDMDHTWKCVKLPSNTKAIEVRWVYKLKYNLDGSIAKHTGKLVARGFLQRPCLYYSYMYSPFARLETIMLVVALACKKNRLTFHFDVKYDFLNEPLDEEVYVTQPTGFVEIRERRMVYIPHKALNSLKHAPRHKTRKLIPT